ncbi:MAG: hypothetical protein OZ948_07505 [Deltaproteobacteria bacterium]|nr:hypothetical protein [Deltaproteobacteria bacterium]
MRLPPLALALLLAIASPPLFAAAARAGELIRYRTPDGSIGFVDDERRLPAGAEVLSRTPLEPPAPRPAAAASIAPAAPPEEAPPATAPPADRTPAGGAGHVPPATETPAPAADASSANPGCDAIVSPLDKVRCRSAHERRCSHYGLAAGCPLEQLAAAADWCARGAALREEIAGLDDEWEAARESLEQCRQHGGVRPDCETDELDEAEAARRTGERRVEALEEQCHAEGCLPGWVREGCESDPTS